MPRLKHYYGQNHVHYLTANTYRKARVFDSDRCKRKFVKTLHDIRTDPGFRIIGCVLMPEHPHPLIWPGSLANPSQTMQKLSERTANFILRSLPDSLAFPCRRKVLKRFAQPPAVRDHAHYRVWNRRGYDMNIWSEKKIHERLNYMHNNPARRGLVAQPGDWPWSSCGTSTLTTDQFWRWTGYREHGA
jgi:putative transposase